MMREIGIKNINELYSDVPEKYLLGKELEIPQRGLSEFEVKRHVEKLLSKIKQKVTCPSFSEQVAGPIMFQRL